MSSVSAFVSTVKSLANAVYGDNVKPEPEEVMPMTTPITNEAIIVNGVAYTPLIQNGFNVIGTINNQVCWIRSLQKERDAYQSDLANAKAELVKVKARLAHLEASSDRQLTVCFGDKDDIRLVLEEEGWTKGKSERTIHEMVESAYEFADGALYGNVDTSEYLQNALEEWWADEGEEEFKESAYSEEKDAILAEMAVPRKADEFPELVEA